MVEWTPTERLASSLLFAFIIYLYLTYGGIFSSGTAALIAGAIFLIEYNLIFRPRGPKPLTAETAKQTAIQWRKKMEDAGVPWAVPENCPICGKSVKIDNRKQEARCSNYHTFPMSEESYRKMARMEEEMFERDKSKLSPVAVERWQKRLQARRDALREYDERKLESVNH
jgi:hypothetical protein